MIVQAISTIPWQYIVYIISGITIGIVGVQVLAEALPDVLFGFSFKNGEKVLLICLLAVLIKVV